MDKYDVLYLEALNKLVLYHNSNLVFEGTLDDIPAAQDKLLQLYDADLIELEEAKDAAFNKLENLDIKRSTNQMESYEVHMRLAVIESLLKQINEKLTKIVDSGN